MRIFTDIKHLALRLLVAKVQKIKKNTIVDKPRDTDYQLGASPIQKTILRPDGQWLDYVPEGEVQAKNTETMACVSFSLLNILEILAKEKYGEIWNKSDRYTAKMTNTSRSGNSQVNVIDITRNTAGVVNEELWPYDKSFTWEGFYSSIPESIKVIGKDWLKEYRIGYEVVHLNNRTAMKEGLKYGPLWVAGFSWAESNGLYRSWGRANHSFVIVGYVEGQYWLAFDSYSPFVKKLAWDYQFGAMRVITLDKIGDTEVMKLIKKGIKFVIRPQSHGELYKLTANGLEYIESCNAREVLSQEIPLSVDVASLAESGKIVGISEEFYNKLK